MLAEQGRHALTTRAVAAAAGAHAPTIYRQFGDMRGLLDAVASHGFDDYLANSVARDRHDDPVDDLRSSWDAHVRFGLTHPALYALMFGDPATTVASTAADRAAEILTELIARIVAAGRLRVSEDHANAMIGRPAWAWCSSSSPRPPSSAPWPCRTRCGSPCSPP